MMLAYSHRAICRRPPADLVEHAFTCLASAATDYSTHLHLVRIGLNRECAPTTLIPASYLIIVARVLERRARIVCEVVQ